MKKTAILAALVSFSLCSYAQTPVKQEDKAPEVKTEQHPDVLKPAPAVKVEKLAVGLSIENKQLVGKAVSFPLGTEKVYVWAKISTDAAPCRVIFFYYLDGKKVREIPVDVKFSPYRTWSWKNVTPGDWKVEVRDEAGNVLASSVFKVTETPAPVETNEEKK